MTDLRSEFLLDPSVHFLNHGSFGACPRIVFEEYQRWQRELERQPVEFLGRRIHPELEIARAALAEFIHCAPDEVVYVDNATWGVNVIARSLDLKPGDEILTTDHEYGACDMALEWECRDRSAKMVRHPIPLPVTTHADLVESMWSAVTPQTRVIFLSHITSPTALRFPVEEICRRARAAGILTLIDGAHAPGQIDLDMGAIGADFYTGNLHKWLSAPKGAGFLYARPEHHGWIESAIVSWGWGRSGTIDPEATFVQRNEWQGTRDYSAFLTVPTAIKFFHDQNWPAVRDRCHELVRLARARVAELTGLPPMCPDSREWFAQLASLPVKTDDPLELKRRLIDDFNVEIPVVSWHGQNFVRVSIQGYNNEGDVDALVEALKVLV